MHFWSREKGGIYWLAIGPLCAHWDSSYISRDGGVSLYRQIYNCCLPVVIIANCADVEATGKPYRLHYEYCEHGWALGTKRSTARRGGGSGWPALKPSCPRGGKHAVYYFSQIPVIPSRSKDSVSLIYTCHSKRCRFTWTHQSCPRTTKGGPVTAPNEALPCQI